MNPYCYLIVFIIYIPIYLVVLILIGSKNLHYSAHKSVISNLASTEKPWGNIFNIFTSLYGLLSLILPYSLIYKYSFNLPNLLGALVLITIGIGTFLIGFFPVEQNRVKHRKISNFIFAIVIVTGLTFASIFNQFEYFPNTMRLVNIGVLIIGTIFVLITLIRRQANSMLEWSTLIGTFIWNISLSLSLLRS
jgi:hypothetical membrane protein